MPVRELPSEIEERLRGIPHEFAAQGSELSLTDVAAAIEIPRATLYYHFSGRDDLLAHLVRVIIDQNREAVEKAIKDAPGPVERVRAIIEAEVDFLTSQEGTTRALFTNLGRIGDLWEIAQQTHEAFHHPLTVALEQGAASGAFRADLDIETVVSAVFGSITMTVLHYAVSETAIETADMRATLVSLALRGIT